MLIRQPVKVKKSCQLMGSQVGAIIGRRQECPDGTTQTVLTLCFLCFKGMISTWARLT